MLVLTSPDHDQRHLQSPEHYHYEQTYHLAPPRLQSLSTRSLAPIQPLMNKVTRQPFNPTVRIHTSTPSPSPSSSPSPPPSSSTSPQTQRKAQPMLAPTAWVQRDRGDGSFPGAGYLGAPSGHTQNTNYHDRRSSGSSVASAGPPSPLDHAVVYPHIVATPDCAEFSDFSDISPLHYDDFDHTSTPLSAQTSKSLPIPVGTPMPHNLIAGLNQVAAQSFQSTDMARKQISVHEHNGQYTYSGPQSTSSVSHDSPRTPHTNFETEFDDSKSMYHGFPTSAAFSQAMQDVFPEQLYLHTTQPCTAQSPQAMAGCSNLSPRKSVFVNRLQAANQDHIQARTNSPATSVPRQQSPFRPDSPWAEQLRMNPQLTRQRMGTMPPPPPQQTQEAPKSVSPKELMLDEPDLDEVDAIPLFPSQSKPVYRRRPSSNMSSTFQSGLYSTPYNQVPSVQIPQQYPFVSPHSRQEGSQQSVPDTPDFPAHIVSMESTVEEGPSEPSSQQQTQTQPQPQPQTQTSTPTPIPRQKRIQRPDDTFSDAGTYGCTDRGCTQRFMTSSKLQKHKREAHKSASPVIAAPVTPSSAAQSVSLRNPQTGPHKCERINPGTGKTCNSIFSRPYDLTRHEDTIHNARKQKVRCHLCTEEKTFSRNDALTRHMRVVHPDIDWPGKTRRKNGRA